MSDIERRVTELERRVERMRGYLSRQASVIGGLVFVFDINGLSQEQIDAAYGCLERFRARAIAGDLFTADEFVTEIRAVAPEAVAEIPTFPGIVASWCGLDRRYEAVFHAVRTLNLPGFVDTLAKQAERQRAYGDVTGLEGGED